jgi:hypothetical protein
MSGREESFGHALRSGMSKQDLMKKFSLENEAKYARTVQCLVELGTVKLTDLNPDQKPQGGAKEW